jgi:hypothetical protein
VPPGLVIQTKDVRQREHAAVVLERSDNECHKFFCQLAIVLAGPHYAIESSSTFVNKKPKSYAY